MREEERVLDMLGKKMNCLEPWILYAITMVFPQNIKRKISIERGYLELYKALTLFDKFKFVGVHFQSECAFWEFGKL